LSGGRIKGEPPKPSLSGGLKYCAPKYAGHVHHSFSEGGDRGILILFAI